MMKRPQIFPFSVVFLTVFASCASAPEIKTYFVEAGVVQYFLPPTEWKAKDSSRLKARLDITYRTGTDTPATINISFIDTKRHPQRVSSVSLEGEGVYYPLEDIFPLFYNPETHELRISGKGNRDTLADILQADNLVLRAVLDGDEYLFTPERSFFSSKDRFIAGIRV
jgi:hypothetical protein